MHQSVKIKTLNLSTVCVSVFALLFIIGCGARSISNSGYDRGYYGYRGGNPFYEGELTEFDVLGIDPYSETTDEAIVKSLSIAKNVMIKKGNSIMLIQSGAMLPDDPMMKEMDKHFVVMPFTGIPIEKKAEKKSHYGKALRLAAAKGGNDTIICYWGTLETAQKNLATKTVSWVPIVGGAIPDESQMMRIRLKFAIIDVKTGSWTIFSPDPISDNAISTSYGRESSDQSQVALLKEKGYKEAVEKLVRIYRE